MAETKKKTTKKSTSKAKSTTAKKAPAKSAKPAAKKTPVKKTTKASTVKKAAPKSATKKTTAKATKSTALNYAKNKNSEKFAIIKLGGSQLKVVEGLKYEIKKIDGVKGDKLEIEDVLLLTDGKEVKIGKPTVKGAKVSLEIDSQKKDKKVKSFKYKAKSRYRKTHGSRQLLTRVVVKKIEG